MFFPEKMLRINIQIEQDFINEVLESIGKTGLLHIDKKQHQFANDTEASRVKTLLMLALKYMTELKVSSNKHTVTSISNQENFFNRIENKLIVIGIKVDDITNKIKESDQELEHFKKAISVKKVLSPIIDTMVLSKELKHIKLRTAIVSMEVTELFRLSMKAKEMLFIIQPLFEQTNAIAIFYEDKYENEITKAFNTFKAIEIDLDYFSDDAYELQQKLQEQFYIEKQALADEYKEQLQDIENYLNAMSALEVAKLSLKKDEKGLELEGWIPKKAVKEFISKIEHAKITVLALEGEAPVLLKTPLALIPFEKLISGFSYPRYGEMNPVIPFTFSFLLLFGLMFGDVGHGLILTFIGLFVKKQSKNYSELGQIYFLSGISSTFIGFIYGSVFGLHHVLPFSIFTPMEDTLTTIMFSIGIGVVIISLSFLLHIFTAIKRKETSLLFVSDGSILWLLVYWFSIGILVKSLAQELDIIYEVILLSLLLVTILILSIRKTKKKAQSLIDLLREFMDTITNTISFLRVGAFALAHAALFMAVFSIARMVSESHGESFFYWFTIILGNIVIIVLEGIVVTIQTLRLEYFEFFKRFFKGGGLPYKPYTLGGKNED